MDLQVLDQKVTEVLLESLDLLDLWAWQDSKVKLDYLVLLDQQASLVLKVSVASQGYLDSKVTEVFLDSKDRKVKLETKGSEVYKVRLVYKGHQGHLETKDSKDQWDWLDMMVLKDQEVIRELQGHLESEVLLGLLEITDFQEHLGFKDLQVFQGIQDGLVPKVRLVNQEESSMQLAPLLLESQDHQGLPVLLALLDLQDYQVPLALLVCLANLVLRVTGDIREIREKQEYQ